MALNHQSAPGEAAGMSTTGKPTTFADVIPIKQTSSHEYQIALEQAWTIGTGTLLTLLLRFHASSNFT